MAAAAGTTEPKPVGNQPWIGKDGSLSYVDRSGMTQVMPKPTGIKVEENEETKSLYTCTGSGDKATWKKDTTEITPDQLNAYIGEDYRKTDSKSWTIWVTESTRAKPRYEAVAKYEAPFTAHSGYYNDFDYRSWFDDSAPRIHHYENGLQLDQVHSNQHYEDGEYYNGLLLGGVIGGGSIVAILVVFCIGLAFGMVICFGYQQKKALEHRKKEDWRQNDDDV
eukprot:225192_1